VIRGKKAMNCLTNLMTGDEGNPPIINVAIHKKKKGGRGSSKERRERKEGASLI